MANGLRPFGLDRNIRHFLWYGGVAGDGLRSVEEEAPLLIQERVLYPAHRHLRAGALRGSGLYNALRPRWFDPIALCAAFTLPRAYGASAFILPLDARFVFSLSRGLRFALLGVAQGLGWCDHGERSPGRFWLPHPPPPGVLLMYIRSTSLQKLYIRNIIPSGLGIPFLKHLALSGWGYALFTQVRGIGILGSSHPALCIAPPR
jgi:hypothetical protein